MPGYKAPDIPCRERFQTAPYDIAATTRDEGNEVDELISAS